MRFADGQEGVLLQIQSSLEKGDCHLNEREKTGGENWRRKLAEKTGGNTANIANKNI